MSTIFAQGFGILFVAALLSLLIGKCEETEAAEAEVSREPRPAHSFWFHTACRIAAAFAPARAIFKGGQ